MHNGYNKKAIKSLGQNFLVDKGVIEEILYGADIGEEDLVIEIGPGMGALTMPASGMAGRLVAIEIDSGLIPILERELAIGGCDPDKTEIINSDILKTDVSELISKQLDKDPALKTVKIIGNLPYYITTPIIMKVLREATEWESLTVMMQKEVADRIKAAPGKKTYGGLSVAVQYYCEVKDICSVPAECFRPRPKVDSAVLRLDRREKKAACPMDEDLFFDCIKAAFSMRRKTLANCLSGFKGLSREEIFSILEREGLPKTIRGEALDIQQFAGLADAIKIKLG